MNIVHLLNRRHVPYEKLDHIPAHSAQQLARTIHVQGKQVAKTVLVRTADGFVIAIVPSMLQVDLDQLGSLLGATLVQLANEEEMMRLFPDVECGVVPPFGDGYGLRTVVDIHLMSGDFVVFEGQNHREAIQMSIEDFMGMEQPIVGRIAREEANRITQ